MPTTTSLSTSSSRAIETYGNVPSLQNPELINKETQSRMRELSNNINTLAKSVKKHSVSVSELQMSFASARVAIDSLEAEVLMRPTIDEQKRFAAQQAALEILKRLLRDYFGIKKNAFPPLSTYEQEQKQPHPTLSFQPTTFSRKTYAYIETSTPTLSPQRPKRLNFDEENPPGYSSSLDSENEIN